MLRRIFSNDIGTCCVRSITVRFCSNDSDGYKKLWPAKIRNVEMNNPVRLRQRPVLFAESRRDRRFHDSDRYEDDYYGDSNRHQHVDRRGSRQNEASLDYSIKENKYQVSPTEDLSSGYSPADEYGSSESYGRSRDHQGYRQDLQSRSESRYSTDHRKKRNNRGGHSYLDDDFDDEDIVRDHTAFQSRKTTIASRVLNKHLLNGSMENRVFGRKLPDSVVDDEQFGGYSQESESKLLQFVGTEAHEKLDKDSENDHFIRLSHRNSPKSVHTFEDKIQRLCSRCRMTEAQELFNKIMKEYRVKPTSYMFSNMVQGYASLGDLKKCFSLYNQMKDMAIEPRSRLYTSLFTVCCTYTGSQQHALESATSLLGLIRHNGVVLEPITYKAAVKAFGKLGDIETAFQLADECPPDGKQDFYMLSSLLIACNSHQEAGFQLALSVWRSMRKRSKIEGIGTPQYNLLLRSLVMGSGDVESLKDLIQYKVAKQLSAPSDEESVVEDSDNFPPTTDFTSSSQPTQKHSDVYTPVVVDDGWATEQCVDECHSIEKPVNECQSIKDSAQSFQNDEESAVVERFISSDSDIVTIDMETSTNPAQKQGRIDIRTLITAPDEYKRIPDILNPKNKIPSDIVIRKVTSPSHRLVLLGGVRGVLKRMNSQNCTPDVQTFYYMWRALPWNLKHDEEMISVIKEYGAMNCRLYNYALFRMSTTHQFIPMILLAENMKEEKISPDMQTFAILSTACNTLGRCRQLLTDMKTHKVEPDLLVLKSVLLKAGSTHFEYLTLVLEEMERYDIQPDVEFIKLLRHKSKISKQRLVEKEQGIGKQRMPIDVETMRAYHLKLASFLDKAEVGLKISHQSQ